MKKKYKVTRLVGYFDSMSEIEDYLGTVGLNKNKKYLEIFRNGKKIFPKNGRT